MKKIVPWLALDRIQPSMPELAGRFPSFGAYSEASISEILREVTPPAQHLEINTLDSAVFLNRSGKFERRALPVEAQFAPAFGVAVADFDGDGNEDVFLGQNFFGVDLDTSRYDAGRGLLLKGDGKGGFTPLSGMQSGIRIYGEQRAAALGDYDGDGRVDLAVGQNGAETRLLHNTGGRPGLRVRLIGPARNPGAIGAAMRLIFAGGKEGPLREIHAGEGYLSQNSLVQIMAGPGVPSRIWVRWPGGRTTTSDIPPGAREITIAPEGVVKSTAANP